MSGETLRLFKCGTALLTNIIKNSLGTNTLAYYGSSISNKEISFTMLKKFYVVKLYYLHCWVYGKIKLECLILASLLSVSQRYDINAASLATLKCSTQIGSWDTEKYKTSLNNLTNTTAYYVPITKKSFIRLTPGCWSPGWPGGSSNKRALLEWIKVVFKGAFTLAILLQAILSMSRDVAQGREPLLKGKALYGWPPCTK